jgi:hypothetical protein
MKAAGIIMKQRQSAAIGAKSGNRRLGLEQIISPNIFEKPLNLIDQLAKPSTPVYPFKPMPFR